ncbi:eukaryotic translation initiation factor 4 gamma 1 [Bufo gargarizans]|uniref:eukaryotic translation initiation factor 4 gamma 1 n=1 Tax=Bufo gargarizans TaxID=30331 RepID=UPI001CF31CC4|nr:eukaryotic translation initiation factor 4 gamma 1 [Bufo gargarizans]XP_044148437.1 eukaryotic translation initiation factor 4 gamma 1 [Bufo gargarizans]XP_044148438.1 eukaryotic translation initiation factor 4 gamma 1 [Bufo gargarizans]
MSKTTQPIGGPPTAPSPGLPQSAFPSAPTAPVVFGPPQTPQMNTQSQPRQHYYPSRTQPPSTATRVQTGSTARPVPPAHVYPAGSQVMMIPSQLSYASQGYYIQGQGRSYVMPTQQYPVQPGAPGFFPSASPTEFSPYAGAYYPAQQQFPPGVPGAQVMINQQQQQQQQQAIPPKRERKTIRIRDPNQGGKDVTDEILSGGRTSSTPTPPQSVGSEVQANGESVHVPIVVRPDDGSKPTQVLTRSSDSPSPSPPAEASLNMAVVCEQDLTLVNTTPELSVPLPGTLNSQEVPLLENPSTQVSMLPEAPTAIQEDPDSAEVSIADITVTQMEPVSEAPIIQPQPELLIPPQTAVSDLQESPLPQEETFSVSEVDFPSQAPPSQSSAEPSSVEANEPDTEATQEQSPLESLPSEDPQPSNGLSEEATVPPAQPEPSEVCHSVPSLDSPIAQPEELLTNGEESSDPQEPEVQDTHESHVSPITEPEEKPVDPTPEVEDVRKEPPPEPEPVASQTAKPADVPVAVAVSAPKKRRKMKDLNRKDIGGDLLDAFKEQTDGTTDVTEPPANPPAAAPEVEQTPSVPVEEQDETWEEKEDKLDENIKPGDLKYKYKEEQWKPLNPEEKKSYDREFLLGFQFIVASMQKPEGLPQITDVVLEKVNKAPLRPLDTARLTGMNSGPDFTPSFANLGRPTMGNRGPQANLGPRRSQQGPRKEPRKIIAAVSLNENVQLNKAEKAWKPTQKRASEEDEPENIKTQELFRRVRSILNKLTPQMFQQLMKQVQDLPIDTEDRLKGVIDLIFEKAISEPNFSVAYANMCRCLMGLKVPTTDKPGVTVNFRKLLLNRCQKEFEKDKDDDEVFERKQKEMDAATTPEEKTRLNDALVEARDSARRRSLGNIKFIGELFKLKMLTEAIMHDCVVKLLKNHDEESLECLCRLLSTIGKDLDFERAKPRMDQYFNQMDKIIKERKTSSRIRFMIQDVIDLRMCNWVPRRADQGPKTIDQIHKEAELEKQREQVKVQHLMSKQDKRREPQGRPAGGRGSQTNDDGWNTVPISKGSRPIDTSRISKITKLGAIDSNQLLAPGGRLSWGKGSSGGTGAKPAVESAPESGRPATSTLNRFSALQQSASAESQDARRTVQRGSSSRDRSERDRGGERFDRGERYDKGDLFERSGRPDRARTVLTKRSFSKETDDHSRERERQIPQEAVRKVASMTEPRDRSKDSIKHEPPTAAAAPVASSKPTMSEEELERKSKSIIEEYLHINDMKEALQCVQELNCGSLLFIFVRNVIESTLERSTIAREHTGLLLYSLVKNGTLPKEQYYKGVLEVLEVADDMEIDIPHIWLYLAELISPVLTEEGIPMGELFRELTKPLTPIGKAGVLLAEILGLQCKDMSHKKAGALWQESRLSWKEFLSKDQDMNKFISDNKLEYTLGDESETPSKTDLSPAELDKMLTKLLKENSSNQKIFDCIEGILTDQQLSSNQFVRTLMNCVCNSAIILENPCRVDVNVIKNRAKLLAKYLNNETKELQALYALQALVVKLDQPPNLLRMFFDALYDEDVIKEEPFYKWESSKDPAEQQGKGVALKSVTAFFTWLREAEDESDTDHKD